jgi:hypothetical protein
MITSGQDDITRTVKWWRLENFPDDTSYEGTEPEVNRALTAARIAYAKDHPREYVHSDFFDAIKVTVDAGKIVISYEMEEG